MSDQLKTSDKIQNDQILVKYDGKTFGPYPNPDHNLTIDIVQRELAKNFPEAAKCEISQKQLDDGSLELTFTKKAGTKGSGSLNELFEAMAELTNAAREVANRIYDEHNECMFCKAEPYPNDDPTSNEPVYDHDEECPATKFLAALDIVDKVIQ